MKRTSLLFSILLTGILFSGHSSLADIQTKSAAKKSSRSLDLSLSKKSATLADKSRVRDDGYEKIDMSQFKEFEISAQKASVKSICTSKSGVKYKQNQTGFDDCLRQAELEKSSQHKPSDPNSTSVGVEFGDDN